MLEGMSVWSPDLQNEHRSSGREWPVGRTRRIGALCMQVFLLANPVDDDTINSRAESHIAHRTWHLFGQPVGPSCFATLIGPHSSDVGLHEKPRVSRDSDPTTRLNATVPQWFVCEPGECEREPNTSQCLGFTLSLVER